MKKIVFIIIATLVLTNNAFSQSTFSCVEKVEPNQMPFQAGEKLVFTVSYSAALVKTDIADITIKSSSEIHSGVECYRINAVGKTKDFYSVFFEMYDVYDSWIDKSNLRPVRQENRNREGGYRYHSIFRYDWANKKVFTWGKNLGSGNQESFTLALKNCSFDAMAMFINIRASDLTKLKMGATNTLNLVLGDKVSPIRFKLLKKEVRYIPRMGNVNTLKFSCELVNSNGESFPDGSEFYLWVSDDKNKLPLQIETPIRVGTVKASIYSWSGLKHPMSSLILKK